MIPRLKHKKLKPIFNFFILIFCGVSFLNGCAFGPPKDIQKSAQEMYNEGLKLLNKKKYERAAEAFQKLKEEHPLSSYTPLAELRIADALFFNKSYAEAVNQYEEFRKLHPLHGEVPYAIYQMGMCYFKQMLSVDRDQTATEKALEQFRYLIENFPHSPHTPAAREKVQACRKQLAEHEYYIAHFYLRMKKYRAALGRFEKILQAFPDLGYEEKLKPLIAKCHAEIAKIEEKEKKKEKGG
ncbi:MAG: outer membrane protein assembly factor BamD [Thermodesulfobacteriota bacterium]